MNKKNPIIAGLVNMLIPGLGYIYVDPNRWARAIVAFISCIGFLSVLVLQNFIQSAPGCVGGVAFFFLIALFIDGNQAARKYNDQLAKQPAMITSQTLDSSILENSIFGFIGWITFPLLFNLLIVSAISNYFDPSSEGGGTITLFVLIVVQVVGLGPALLAFRRKMHGLGRGILYAFILYILGAFLNNCIPPLLLPFPLSLLSGC